MQTSTALSALVLIVHALGVIAALHATLHARTAQGAIAWAVALVAMPYLTLLPYLIFGPQHLDGFRSSMAIRKTVEAAIGFNDSTPARHDVTRGLATLSRLGETRFSPTNSVTLLINGAATFDAILRAIADARHSVLVQTFLVRDDKVGRSVQRALIAKAQAGCAVYFLYDAFGSLDLPSHYVAALRTAGVHVQAFAARARGWQRFRLNFRNHRKIVVVDNQIAFIGGHNYGDEYLGAKTLGAWRDTHIKISGPAAAHAIRCFAEDWYWVTRRVPNVGPCDPEPCGGVSVALIGSGPVVGRDVCGLLFVQLIQMAQRRLWITSPYFVPDDAVMIALRLATLRGVDVRILIPNRPDHLIVFAASSLHAHEAVTHGIRVYRYQAGFLHQKVALVDHELVAIGTANLDNRSFRLNFEITALVADAPFAKRVETMLAEDLVRSSEVTVHDMRASPVWWRIRVHVARLFGPIL